MTTDETRASLPPALLHNMSSKPRTMVDVRVAPVDGPLVSFSLDNMGPALNRVLRGRSRATLRGSLAAFVCRDDVERLAALLDNAWSAHPLHGAVLFYEGLPAMSDHYSPRQCRDPLVVLNVLARARGNVLLSDAPLVLQPRALDRQLVTDDPRLPSSVKEIPAP